MSKTTKNVQNKKVTLGKLPNLDTTENTSNTGTMKKGGMQYFKMLLII